MVKRVLNKLKVKDILAKAKMKPVQREPKSKLKTIKKKGKPVDQSRGIPAKDFLNKDVCEVAVVNTELKASQDKYGYNSIDGHKFPEHIIIIKAQSFDDVRIHLTYYMVDVVRSVYVPKDFKFEPTDVGLRAKYEAYEVRNLYQNLGHSFTVGSDPEMFVEDATGKVIPAFNFLGSKEKSNRTHTREGTNNGNTKLYWDGFQAEFETLANSCLGWHTDSVYCGIKGLYDEAKKHNKDAKLSLKTTMDIDIELLQVSAEEHVQFGCMPSFNAYGMKGLEMNGREVPFRSAGGHIHYGLGKITHEQAIPIVKALDAIIGVACVSLFAKYDDPRRRRMYGLAGEYRLPPHGLEYRVLSNAWMCHPAIMNLVFDTSRKALVFGRKGLLKHWQADEQEVIETINTCNVERARAILERNKGMFEQMLWAAYGSKSDRAVAGLKAFFTGVENVIANPEDIENNWMLNGLNWVWHAGSPGKNWDKASKIINEGKKVG